MVEHLRPGTKNPGRRRAAATVVLALGLLIAVATPAAAEHRKLRWGVNETRVGQADVQRLGDANARVLRTGFSWVAIAGERRARAGCTNPGIYDWNGGSSSRSINYDALVSRTSRKGVRLLPVIVGSPRWVARSSTHAPRTSRAAHMLNYRCFLNAVVERYGRGGEYGAEDPRFRPITVWQVWNEPNLASFATEGGVNPREYARLVQVSRNTIVGADPRAKTILAGLPELTKSGFSSRQFLRQFYRVRGIKRHFDAAALHPYAADSRGVKGALVRFRRLMRNVRDRRRPLWLTETGWASHGTNATYLVKGAGGQARQLRRTFKMLRSNRKRFKVGTVAWFRWRDQARPVQNRGAFDYTGLFKKSGRPKRACRAFVRFTNGRCAPIRASAPQRVYSRE